ncbi:hypothetical protein [Erwinia aphidicola]
MCSTAVEFSMVPIPQGSKQLGALQVVIGAIALVAAFFTAGGSMAAWGLRWRVQLVLQQVPLQSLPWPLPD